MKKIILAAVVGSVALVAAAFAYDAYEENRLAAEQERLWWEKHEEMRKMRDAG